MILRIALYLWAAAALLNVPNLTDAVQQTYYAHRDHAPAASVRATFTYHATHYWENNR